MFAKKVEFFNNLSFSEKSAQMLRNGKWGGGGLLVFSVTISQAV